MKQNQAVKKTYETPILTKHQRLQKVTLGTVTTPPDAWLLPGK